jgi:hypothetical protein
MRIGGIYRIVGTITIDSNPHVRLWACAKVQSFGGTGSVFGGEDYTFDQVREKVDPVQPEYRLKSERCPSLQIRSPWWGISIDQPVAQSQRNGFSPAGHVHFLQDGADVVLGRRQAYDQMLGDLGIAGAVDHQR